ncbi:MAG: 8-oxo-dGTP diphosphatase [Candidatus Doudnabacteria bacterium]|nr:8-oxo-dGTP diphosphatase [Candidatus Doudnabacteria bacterium]
MEKILTLCIVTDSSRILLGMKKRGFGQGRWNGFGGKVTDDETVEEAAEREAKEEADITVRSLRKIGLIRFTFENDPDVLVVHIFTTERYSGEPKETDEMKPQWFNFTDIPYEDMWPADRYWLPYVIEKKQFAGNVHFKDMNTILTQKFNEVK